MLKQESIIVNATNLYLAFVVRNLFYLKLVDIVLKYKGKLVKIYEINRDNNLFI